MPPILVGVTDNELLEVLQAAIDAGAAALDQLGDWGLADTRPGQYRSDLASDAAVLQVLTEAGLGVLSEESGLSSPPRDVIVVVDPLDGSTNASRGVPWYAMSLCAVDDDGPRATIVVNLATGARYDAVRGGGARRDGEAIMRSTAPPLAESIIGVSGLPPRHAGWGQFRALGAAALDLCAVADGTLDGFIDCSTDAHGVWDYLGGVLVCAEAGVGVVDALGRDLVVLDHGARRTPVAGASPALLDQLVSERRTW